MAMNDQSLKEGNQSASGLVQVQHFMDLDGPGRIFTGDLWVWAHIFEVHSIYEPYLRMLIAMRAVMV